MWACACGEFAKTRQVEPAQRSAQRRGYGWPKATVTRQNCCAAARRRRWHSVAAALVRTTGELPAEHAGQGARAPDERWVCERRHPGIFPGEGSYPVSLLDGFDDAFYWTVTTGTSTG